MKHAFVTGASEGIGYIFAKELCKRGYAITAVARSKDKLETLMRELPGGDHRLVVADLSTQAGQSTAVKALGEMHYDLLVNNAGVGVVGKFTEVPLEKTLQMMHLNCDALVTLAHAFLGQAQRGDALLNVSSTIGYLSMPTMATYCATKAFVTTFSEALWGEQKERGVFVQALCPGITSTRFNTNAGGRAEDVPQILSETPEQLVAFALKRLEERAKPTVISGLANSVFARATKLMPRGLVVSLMGSQAPL